MHPNTGPYRAASAVTPEPSLQPYLRTLKDVEITIMVSINLKQFHHGAQVRLELWILPLWFLRCHHAWHHHEFKQFNGTKGHLDFSSALLCDKHSFCGTRDGSPGTHMYFTSRQREFPNGIPKGLEPHGVPASSVSLSRSTKG